MASLSVEEQSTATVMWKAKLRLEEMTLGCWMMNSEEEGWSCLVVVRKRSVKLRL